MSEKIQFRSISSRSLCPVHPLQFLMFMICSLSPCSIKDVVDRGVRKREQGAVPDNGIALERREAPGPSQGPARPGTPTTLKALGPGSLARRSADRKADLREPIARLPGASRRSIPSCQRDGKRERRAGPGARIQSPGSAEHWRSASTNECWAIHRQCRLRQSRQR